MRRVERRKDSSKKIKFPERERERKNGRDQGPRPGHGGRDLTRFSLVRDSAEPKQRSHPHCVPPPSPLRSPPRVCSGCPGPECNQAANPAALSTLIPARACTFIIGAGSVIIIVRRWPVLRETGIEREGEGEGGRGRKGCARARLDPEYGIY